MSQKYKQLGLAVLIINTQVILSNGSEGPVSVKKLPAMPVDNKSLLARLFTPRDLRDAAGRGVSVVSGLNAWYMKAGGVIAQPETPVGSEEVGLDLGSPKLGA